MMVNPNTFDFWNEAEADAALEGIHAKGGKALVSILTILNDEMDSTIDADASIATLKRHIRLWRLEQSRRCDAILMEAGSEMEAEYLAVIERAKQELREGRPEPLETIQAELTRILDLPNNPHVHWLKEEFEKGETDTEEGPYVTMEEMEAELDRIIARSRREKP